MCCSPACNFNTGERCTTLCSEIGVVMASAPREPKGALTSELTAVTTAGRARTPGIRGVSLCSIRRREYTGPFIFVAFKYTLNAALYAQVVPESLVGSSVRPDTKPELSCKMASNKSECPLPVLAVRTPHAACLDACRARRRIIRPQNQTRLHLCNSATWPLPVLLPSLSPASAKPRASFSPPARSRRSRPPRLRACRGRA